MCLIESTPWITSIRLVVCNNGKLRARGEGRVECPPLPNLIWVLICNYNQNPLFSLKWRWRTEIRNENIKKLMQFPTIGSFFYIAEGMNLILNVKVTEYYQKYSIFNLTLLKCTFYFLFQNSILMIDLNKWNIIKIF